MLMKMVHTSGMNKKA